MQSGILEIRGSLRDSQSLAHALGLETMALPSCAEAEIAFSGCRGIAVIPEGLASVPIRNL